MDKARLNELRKISKTLDPTIRIGKLGVSDSTYSEIIKVLKKKRIVKVKILKNCEEERDKIIESILSGTDSILVNQIGRVFTLYKEGNFKNDPIS